MFLLAIYRTLIHLNKSLNQSKSNLSKANRFTQRELHEKDLVALPAPASYDLSSLHSINKNVSLNRETNAKKQFSTKKRYDRFINNIYYKELERFADQSPGPCAYENTNKIKLRANRMSCDNLFGKADRGLILKKEDKDSPSPTKYDVKYEVKGTISVKGPTFGSAPKKFSLF